MRWPILFKEPELKLKLVCTRLPRVVAAQWFAKFKRSCGPQFESRQGWPKSQQSFKMNKIKF